MKYGSRVTAPVERVKFSGFEAPLQSFKEMSAAEIARKEKEKADQIAAKEREENERASNLERTRKEAEEARKRQEKASKEQREQYRSMSKRVDAPSNLNMYGAHYQMLEDIAKHLADPENIKKYASSSEGEMQFNSLVEQLMTLTDTFEGYYKQTYGDYDSDDIGASTWQAVEKRNREGVKGGDLNYDTPYAEMVSRLDKLEGRMHEKMEIRGGRFVFVDSEGNEIIPGEDMLDLNVFQSEVSSRAPQGGAGYIAASHDPEVMNSDEAVVSHAQNGLQDPVVMRDAAAHYVEKMMVENPDFSKTPEEVEADPVLRDAAQRLFIKEAIEESNRRVAERTSAPTSGLEDIDIGATESKSSTKQAEDQESQQKQNQASDLPTAEEVEATITEEEVIDEMASALERETGKPLTEEEKQMLMDPEVQAMMRAAGYSFMDMSRITPEDPRSRGDQPTSGLESIDIGGGTQVRPRSEEAPTERSFDEVKQSLADMGINLRDTDQVIEALMRPDTPLSDMLRDRRQELSRAQSFVNDQKLANQEAVDQLAADFGNKFSGDMQLALATDFGRRNKSELEAAFPNQGGQVRYENEATNDLMSLPIDVTIDTDPSTSSATATRSFEGEEKGMIPPKVNINPVDINSEPQDLKNITYDVESRTFDVQIGDETVKIYLKFDDDGNVIYEGKAVTDEGGDKVSIVSLIDQSFNDIYGPNSFPTLLNEMQRKASRAAYGLD